MSCSCRQRSLPTLSLVSSASVFVPRRRTDLPPSADFLPVILTGGGFSIRDTLLLIAPAYVFSAVYIWPVAYMADRLQKRGLFIMINALICLVGCCIMGYADKIGVRYFGVYVAIAGCQGELC